MLLKTTKFVMLLVIVLGSGFGIMGCETFKDQQDTQNEKQDTPALEQARMLDIAPFPKDAVQVSQQLMYPCGETVMCPQFFSEADLGCKAFFDQGETFIVERKGNNSCALGALHQQICQANLDPVAAEIVCFRAK